MSKAPNKTMIGLFVMGAVALIVLAVGVLGSGRFFQERFTYVLVFDGTVSGLNVGAPVNFRGVRVAEVSDVRIHFDIEEQDIIVLVFVQFLKGTLGRNTYDALLQRGATHAEVMAGLVERGLRARLEMQSLVTGQLGIGLDFFPDRPAVYTNVDPETPEIPTIPTALQALAQTLQEIPLHEIMENINRSLESIAAVVETPEFGQAIVNINAVVQDVQHLIRNVDAQVQPLSTELTATLRDSRTLIGRANEQIVALGTNLNQAVGDGRSVIHLAGENISEASRDFQETLATVSGMIENVEGLVAELRVSARADSALMFQVRETLREIEKMAMSLRNLADQLDRHPESLLRGKGSPRGN
ncbi:MlaD family protein [Desulfonatronum thioautotrophicum]|uniref:MlaD family protein n=1 Tax=Desulfonatronum thioautotrophicum TaxID=617001 RepID=UPI000A04B3F6|nr:MlaD family protein [Desulfonatronum thioautotrophicum]